MPVEIFTKTEFEQALPELAYELGFIQNEWTYRVPVVKGEVEIEIRSSVGANNQSADTGQDSIRCWLVNGDGKPLGSKVSKYITRVKGWDKRLLNTLRTLWSWAQWAGYCTECKVPLGVYKVKTNKNGNKGKIFKKCRECNGHYEFMEK